MLRKLWIAWLSIPLAFVTANACSGVYTSPGAPEDAASKDAPAATQSDGANSIVDANGAADSGGDGDGSTCKPIKPPANAIVTASIKLQGVNIGDSSTTAWSALGFDIDNVCTTPASTNVCTLVGGASKNVQTDGKNGIDNSFGENIVPIFDGTIGNFFTSGTFYISITNGVGVMTYDGQGTVIAITVVDAKLDVNLQMFTAIVPTDELVSDMNAWLGRINVALCSGGTHDSVDTSIRQASDILSDGTNGAGKSCDGISLGLSYASYTNDATPPGAGNDPCGD